MRGYSAINEWVILIRLHGQLFNMTVIQVCAPITDAKEAVDYFITIIYNQV